MTYMTIKTATGPTAQLDLKLLDRYLQLLGSDVRVFIPFFEQDPGANAELTDYGPKGHKFLNETAFDNDPFLRGSVLAYDFNGTDEALSMADHADFTFGNGTTDEAFSLGCWVNMKDATNSVLMSRYDATTGATNKEWLFFSDGTDYLRFICYDDSVPANIGRAYQTALTENVWKFLVGTYDGSAASSGINIYLDGVAVDNANDNDGVYVAMEDKTVVTTIGYRESAAGLKTRFFDGYMALPFICGDELSAATVKKLYDLGRIMLHL